MPPFVARKERMKTIVIDCLLWCRGRVDAMEWTGLLNRDGRRCCLGFHCSQLGVEDRHLINSVSPGWVRKYLPADSGLICSLETSGGWNSVFSRKAMVINDDHRISDLTRIRKLKKLAKEYGFNYVFINRRKAGIEK